MGVIGLTLRFRIAKFVISKMAAMVASLKILKQHLYPKGNSDYAETWWEALGRHGDSELLNLFHSDIQNGRLEILQMTLPPKPKYKISPNLMAGIRVTEIQNC